MIFINQNSFTIAAGALLLALLAFLRRGGLDLGKALALAQIVGGGRPVLLEFQSPF